MSEPLVSIACITYNHEKYIADAIEGFLMQETSFPIEVLIHDDASTDRTAEIIRSYEKNYPDLIKPIYQTENQYSQGKRPSSFNLKRAKGKYIALCEGDDYWIDPHKLQKQIDAMEEHPECNMCFHPVFIMNKEGVIESRPNNKYPKEIKVFSTSEVILLRAGYFPTASTVLRSTNIEHLVHPPEWMLKLKGEHTCNTVFGSLGGGALFIPDIMAVRRQSTESSFSRRLSNDDKFALEWANSMCYCFDKLNETTNYLYKEEFEKVKWRHCLGYLKSISRPDSHKRIFFEENKTNMPGHIKLCCMLLTHRSFATLWLVLSLVFRSPFLLINHRDNPLSLFRALYQRIRA